MLGRMASFGMGAARAFGGASQTMGRGALRAGMAMSSNPRASMAIAGAVGGGMIGGWEGAAVGAGFGAMGSRGRVSGFGKKTGGAIASKFNMGFSGTHLTQQLGGKIGAGMALGAAGGFGAAIVGSGISAMGSNVSALNKPYSSFGQSYGSFNGRSPYGSTFSGMGMR